MIADFLHTLPGAVLSAFLVFCRVGCCLMLIPAVGSARVPVRVRLMLCLGASAAVSATLGAAESLSPEDLTAPALASLVAVETGKGLFIGFMARFFFASLQFLADAAANAIGLSTVETSAEDGKSLPPIVSLISLAASALFVITDQHLEVLRALVQSYKVLPFGAQLNMEAELTSIVGVLGSASLLALQICSPFLVFGVTINFLFGILNRLAPQVPVYFVSMPFVVGGGLMLLYFLSDDFFSIFIIQFSSWLLSGST